MFVEATAKALPAPQAVAQQQQEHGVSLLPSPEEITERLKVLDDDLLLLESGQSE